MELIPRARLTTQFLESNASTHESVFGAIAEIVDNAYDSGSKKLEIDIGKPDGDSCGDYYILMRDSGCGMSPTDVANVIAYGWTSKTDDPLMIGMYGNGLKSGSMRVGNDCLIMTKRNNECSALMISRTFIENKTNKENEVICPCPSWKIVADKTSGQVDKLPMHETKTFTNLDAEALEITRHDTEVDLLLKYSPFSTEEELLGEFDQLAESGTCIYLYNLSLTEQGQPELCIDYNGHDEQQDDLIDVGNHDDQAISSLRTYLMSLYLKPKMEIYLRQTLIRPIRVQDLMHERRKFILPQQKFRSIAKSKIATLKDQAKKMEQKARKAKGATIELQKKINEQTSAERLKELRLKNMQVEQITSEIAIVEATIKSKQKASEVKDFVMHVGYNIRDRKSSGLRLFNKNRLIVDIDGKSWAKWPLGVIASVDVPASLMQPSMSKQRFSDDREFSILQKLCLERAREYSKRIYFEFDKWAKLGYENMNVDLEPRVTDEVKRRWSKALPNVFRCTECGKYRAIDDYDKMKGINAALFTCEDNPDPKYNSCTKKEQEIYSKQLEVLPPVKMEKPDSDVEEVAVSPERKKMRKHANGALLSRKRIQDSDDDSDSPVVQRRLRRKRKSGQGRGGGNEVTSGFDRHRMVSSGDDSSDSDQSEEEKEPRKKTKSDTNGDSTSGSVEVDKVRKQNQELLKRIEQHEARNRGLLEEMRSCVKHFYPTSWKASESFSHRNIESWDHDTISRNSKSWKESYTRDLKSIVSTCEKKKALKAKIDVADQLLNVSDKDELMKKIRALKQEASHELRKLKESKS